MNGIREFRVQRIKERLRSRKKGLAGVVSAWSGDLKRGMMFVEVRDDLHRELG